MGRALNVIGVPTGAATFTAALEGLTALDVQLLRDDPSIPPLYEAGIVYTKEATSKWRNILDVLATKSGDCEALAPWRAAELRVSGEDPGAQVLVYPSGASKFHAVVLRGDGTIEDPSVLLGMKAPKNLIENYTWWNREVAPRVFDQQPAPSTDVQVLGFDDDDVACVGLAVDHAPGTEIVTFDVVGTPDGYRGQFRVPLADGRALYGVSSTSGTEDEAERKAAAVLGFVGSVWSDLEALAPGPQAAAAIRLASNQHVQNLAKAAYGKAKSIVRPGSSSGGSGDYVRPRPPMPAPSALLDDVDPLVATPLPSDDQQPLADVDTFLQTPPSGYDAALAPDASANVLGVWSEHEDTVIGYINAALVSGSRPARRGGGGGGGRSSSAGRSGGQRSSAQQRPAQQQTAQQQQGGAGWQRTAIPASAAPLAPSGPAFAPGGGGFGGGGFGGGRGGQQQQGGRPGQQQQGGRPGQQQRQRDQQQQQGGGGGGDSGGGGGGGGGDAPQLANPEDFFAAGPGGQMGDDAFYATAQLAQQVDAFEGNAPADGYAGPDYQGDAAADAWGSFGQGMTDQEFADTAAFAQQAYQQEGGAG